MRTLSFSKSLSATDEMASTVIGTPYYMSPELCQNRPYNNKSDVWALGCLAYEMMALSHAFQASNLNELVLKIMKGVFPPIDADTWGSDLQLVVAKCLRQQTGERPSVAELQALPPFDALPQARRSLSNPPAPPGEGGHRDPKDSPFGICALS